MWCIVISLSVPKLSQQISSVTTMVLSDVAVLCADASRRTHLSLSSIASQSFATSPAAAAAAAAAAAVATAGAPPLLLLGLCGATSSLPAWLLRASSSCRPVPAWLDHARTCKQHRSSKKNVRQTAARCAKDAKQENAGCADRDPVGVFCPQLSANSNSPVHRCKGMPPCAQLTMAMASSLLMLTSVLLMWRMRPSSVRRRFRRQAKKRRASRQGTTPDSTPLANLQGHIAVAALNDSALPDGDPASRVLACMTPVETRQQSLHCVFLP